MPIDLNSATAIVRFTGLGIICFNENKKRCETLLIHDKNHQVFIEIFKPVEFETQNQIYGINYQSLLKYEYVDLKGKNKEYDIEKLLIDIKGIGNCSIDSFEKYKSTRFSRTKSNSDPNDLGWLVNLENDGLLGSGDSKRIQSKLDNVETSKLFICNAELFTDTIIKEVTDDGEVLGNQMFYKTVINNEEQTISHKEYGYLSDYIGAKIEADLVSFRIEIAEQIHSHLLPKTFSPYLIVINNVVPTTNNESSISDMPIYQSFWEMSNTDFTDLMIKSEVIDEYEKLKQDNPFEDPTGGTAGGTRRTCNLVESDAESIEEFLPN